ncbi:UTP--glucose-1-phosphate uridylyltransferase GalU, partial [Desulfovibrio sp.]
MKDIRKVVIPVAGWGTRSLPATKNIPKEMLPIYNKPVIQYVVEEAQRAHIKDVIFVTNRDKNVIEDHFDHNLQLEDLLERSGKLDKLEEVRRVAEMVNILSVRQKRQLGLGHAVLCARELVGDEPFAVMVGDDLMFSGVPGIGQLIEVAMAEKMPVIGVMEVPWEKVSRYGIIDGEEVAPGVYRVRDMVEKPKREDAPSRMAIVGRYVLTPDIFDYLEKVKPGHGGEIQLTDALQAMAKDRGMMAVRMAGMRFDAGDWAEFLSANIYFALQDESLRY